MTWHFHTPKPPVNPHQSPDKASTFQSVFVHAINQFNRIVLNIDYAPGTLVGTRVIMVNKICVVHVYMELKVYRDFKFFYNLCSPTSPASSLATPLSKCSAVDNTFPFHNNITISSLLILIALFKYPPPPPKLTYISPHGMSASYLNVHWSLHSLNFCSLYFQNYFS